MSDEGASFANVFGIIQSTYIKVEQYKIVFETSFFESRLIL